MTEQELLTAFEEARPMLRRVVARIVGDNDADDMLQNAFMNAWRSRGTFRGTCKPATWLHRIAVNTSLMYRRKKYLKYEVEMTDVVAAECTDTRPTPQQRLSSADQLALALRLMRRHCSAANVSRFLVYMESDSSAKEVAGMLGITLPALKASIHRVQVTMRGLQQQGWPAAVSPVAAE